MTSSIPQNHSEILSSIGEAVCNNDKRSKVLCKELLNNTPIEEIENILSKAMDGNQSFSEKKNINIQIGVLRVYKEILKIDKDHSSILTKVAAAASAILIGRNSNVQEIRLNLFEKLFSKRTGFCEAIETVKTAVGNNTTNAFIVQLLTLLIQNNIEIYTGFFVFEKSFSQPEWEARELIPLFEALADKKVEIMKIKLTSRIQIAERQGCEEEKALLFIKAAIDKNLYVEDIYETATRLFDEAINETAIDLMEYPFEILNILAHSNCKKNEISMLVQNAKNTIENLPHSGESERVKQKKLGYFANLETLTNLIIRIKSANNRI